MLVLPAYFLLDEVGTLLLLAGEIALLIADFRQEARGRPYRIQPPFETRYRLSRSPCSFEVMLALDTIVIGDGTRPPTIQFQFEGKHLPTVEAGLFHLTR